MRNLPSILQHGGLYCDNERLRADLRCVGIAHNHIKERRARRAVTKASGGTLADYVAGSEIVPHSATPKRDERPVTMAALDTFARWHARTWIDHQPETNCEAFGDQGFRSTGKFAIADLLAAHGYEYVWAEVDLEAGPLNLLRADHLAQRAPTIWPIGRLDVGGPSGLWMFRSQWAFLEAKHFYNMYAPAALDSRGREADRHDAEREQDRKPAPGVALVEVDDGRDDGHQKHQDGDSLGSQRPSC